MYNYNNYYINIYVRIGVVILVSIFINLIMPINLFGYSSSSYDNSNEIDKSLFVQKHYLGTNYVESNIEEDIDLNNQNRN